MLHNLNVFQMLVKLVVYPCEKILEVHQFKTKNYCKNQHLYNYHIDGR